ncbi:ceramidase [Aspergillus minisclerotigenes]|uniref:Ceramidase n=1 Tax=Aspergillus minisclerotigenes TaxID=656917 RepID=A0A5N6JIU1_9EURO|nr:ceramidase [Aspergillus minisclerotigenes]
MPEWPAIPFFPYPPSKAGYWSPVTSTLNWCEEDYYATIYSAEIVNALTNLLFMWLGIKGLRSYPMQLVDELSMIYTTCLMCYASFSYSRPTSVRVFLAIALTSLAVFITLYYHYLQDPVFHQNAYAILTIVVVLRSMYTMEVTLRPKWRHTTEEDRIAREKQGLPVPSKEHQHYENVRDVKILKTMWFMVIYGLSMFLGGFFIWNLDNHFCTKIRGWRRVVGLPWGMLLEGHGWWHVMTGIGAYLYIIWGIWLRHCLNNRQEEYYLWWPHFWNFPEIIHIGSKDKGENGVAKKSN